MNLTEIKERLLEYKEATKDTDRPIPKFVRMCQMDKQLSENMKSELSFISDYYKKRVTLSIYIYFVLNDILTLEDVPKCDMCGKVRGFEDYSNGFRLTCGSRKCYQRHPDIIAKKHATSMERFGSLKAAYVDTAKKTIQEKYGVDNASQSEEIKQKKINTSRERYGTDYPWQTKEGKCAQKRGVFEKYGVDNISQLESVKQKKMATSFENWGVRNPSQCVEIRRRILKENGVNYELPSGKVIKVDGNESRVYDKLLDMYNEDDLDIQPELSVKYIDEHGEDRYWFPDLVITDPKSKDKLFVEIKSFYCLWGTQCDRTRLSFKIMSSILQNNKTILMLENKDELYYLNPKIENDELIWNLRIMVGDTGLMNTEHIINKLEHEGFSIR